MLLFQDLIFPLCVSVLVSLFLATVNIFYRGKNILADVAEKRIKHDKVDLDNGSSKDAIFSGFEYVDRVPDESLGRQGPVADVAVAETGRGNVGSVDIGRVSGGVGFIKDVLDETDLRSEFGEIVDDDNVEIVKEDRGLVTEFQKEGVNGSFELGNGVIGEKSRGIWIASSEKESCVKGLEVKVLESSYSLECVSGGVEFKEHIVDEIRDKTKYEENFDNEKDLEEIKALENEMSKKIVSHCNEFEEKSFDQSPERVKCSEFVIESDNKEETMLFDEVNGDNEEWSDDWEGIESTELEKRFGDASAFVGSKSNSQLISSLENEVKTQLYGLHKVAIEGSCYVQQPMALKVSARAKWNAWHLLGDMSREVAMEKYIALLSKTLPEWSQENLKE